MYCCKQDIVIYHGAEVNDQSLFRRIKACALNCHACCSVPWCGSCGKQLHFEVTDNMGSTKETVMKEWSGCRRECFTAADTYKLTLPQDENQAALLLAAVQFIDMLYYENPWALCQA